MKGETQLYRAVATVWFAALALDSTRIVVWRSLTQRPADIGLLAFTQAVLFGPWLFYTWSLIWLTERRRVLATPSLRFFSIHAAIAAGFLVAHSALIGAGFLLIDLPGARQAHPAELLLDVWLNFGALDALALVVSLASVTAWRQYQLHRRAGQLETPLATPVESFSVSRRDGLEVVPASSVDWIEASGNYIELHCGQASHLTRANIGQLEAKLDPARFLRVHRSAIVNLTRVRALERAAVGWRLRLTDGHELPVSRRRLKAVQSALTS